LPKKINWVSFDNRCAANARTQGVNSAIFLITHQSQEEIDLFVIAIQSSMYPALTADNLKTTMTIYDRLMLTKYMA
jgi:hypothetical protein